MNAQKWKSFTRNELSRWSQCSKGSYIYLIDRWTEEWSNHLCFDYLLIFLRDDYKHWRALREQIDTVTVIEYNFDCPEDAANAAMGLLHE